jgi:hypothetical protein
MSPTISQRVRFSAPAETLYGGSIGGKNLLIVPDKEIVQAWRARF